MINPSSNRQPRVAFGNLCTSEWIAGCHYLRNLCAALRALDHPPGIVLLTIGGAPPDSSDAILGPYLDESLIYKPHIPYWRRNRLYHRFASRLPLKSPVAHFMREHRLDALFMMGTQDERFDLPLLTWIPDFQHLRMPEMFSADESRERTKRVQRAANSATRIVLSSRDALHDFERFAPQSADKARVLPFVAQISGEVYEGDPDNVCKKYDLPERFFYLPNQFWKHKNHAVVIEALAIAKERYPDMRVVCTGNTHDYRHPAYFPEMLAVISQRFVRDNLILLGTIPHSEIFQLMRQSLAVLQPSLFEGWNTGVEEVKSLGKGIILSDIPVHREQNPAQSIFFDPHQPEVLAACMVEAFETKKPGPDEALETAARQQLPARMRAYGQQFMEILNEAIAELAQ